MFDKNIKTKRYLAQQFLLLRREAGASALISQLLHCIRIRSKSQHFFDQLFLKYVILNLKLTFLLFERLDDT